MKRLMFWVWIILGCGWLIGAIVNSLVFKSLQRGTLTSIFLALICFEISVGIWGFDSETRQLCSKAANSLIFLGILGTFLGILGGLVVQVENLFQKIFIAFAGLALFLFAVSAVNWNKKPILSRITFIIGIGVLLYGLALS